VGEVPFIVWAWSAPERLKSVVTTARQKTVRPESSTFFFMVFGLFDTYSFKGFSVFSCLTAKKSAIS
jgi:hypothetical protein